MCLADHKPLKYLNTKKDLNKRQSQWIKKFVDINPVIQWVLGKDQVVPDILNRRPDYGKCTSLIVKPSFLGNVSKCTFDPLDTEISGLVETAIQKNTNIRVV